MNIKTSPQLYSAETLLMKLAVSNAFFTPFATLTLLSVNREILPTHSEGHFLVYWVNSKLMMFLGRSRNPKIQQLTE